MSDTATTLDSSANQNIAIYSDEMCNFVRNEHTYNGHILSFWWFHGVWILNADVSEHSVPFFIGLVHTTYEDETDIVFRNDGT